MKLNIINLVKPNSLYPSTQPHTPKHIQNHTKRKQQRKEKKKKNPKEQAKYFFDFLLIIEMSLFIDSIFRNTYTNFISLSPPPLPPSFTISIEEIFFSISSWFSHFVYTHAMMIFVYESLHSIQLCLSIYL